MSLLVLLPFSHMMLHTPYWPSRSQCKNCVPLSSTIHVNNHLCNFPQNRQIHMIFHEFWKAFLSNIPTLSIVLQAIISTVSNPQSLCCSLANCKSIPKSWLYLLRSPAFRMNSGTIITNKNLEVSWGKTPCPQIPSVGSAMQGITLSAAATDIPL